MKLSKKQKKTIRKLSKELDAVKIAKTINAKISDVDKYMDKIGQEKSKIKRIKKRIVKRDGVETFRNTGEVTRFWKKHLWFFLVLALIIAAVYSNGMNGEFVSDDIEGFLNNPLTKDFWGSLKTLNIHRIIYAISFMFFKTSPIPTHLTSLAFHILSAILVFTFLRTLFGKKESIYMTALFALHPVNVESVTWISGRGYLIRAIFILIILILHHIYLQSKNKKYFWIAFVVFAVQMITIQSPQNLVLLPILLTYEYFIERRRFKFENIKDYIPYVIAYGVFALSFTNRIVGRVADTNPNSIEKNPYIQRLGYSLYKSLELLIAPVKLSLYHDSEIVTKTMLVIMYIILTVLALYIAKNIFKKRDRYFGWILFALASILYMISPVQVAWFIAERYLYFATISFAVIIVLALTKIEKEFKLKHLTLMSVAIISVIYSSRIIARNMDWKTRKSLWESTINVYPNSARALNNLGDVYSKEGDFEKSIESFEKAIELQPTYADAIHNLGFTYLQMNEYEKAKEKLKEAFALNPTMYQALFHIAAAEFEQGNFEAALEYTQQAIDINPDYTPALNGRMLIQQKILEKSLQSETTIEE